MMKGIIITGPLELLRVILKCPDDLIRVDRGGELELPLLVIGDDKWSSESVELRCLDNVGAD